MPTLERKTFAANAAFVTAREHGTKAKAKRAYNALIAAVRAQRGANGANTTQARRKTKAAFLKLFVTK